MSKASVWAALVITNSDSSDVMEAAKPADLTVAGYVFSVTRAGGLVVASPGASDMTAADAIALRDWLTFTFGL